MSQEKRDNSGALFRNNRKEGKQPDYNGEAVINGKEMRVSAWLKEAKSGTKYLSLAFSDKNDRGGQQSNRREQRPSSDDAPF